MEILMRSIFSFGLATFAFLMVVPQLRADAATDSEPSANFWNSAYLQLAKNDCVIKDLGKYGSTDKAFQLFTSPSSRNVLLQLRSLTQYSGAQLPSMIVAGRAKESVRLPQLTVTASVAMNSPEGVQVLDVAILNTFGTDTRNFDTHAGVFRVSKKGELLAESTYSCR